MVGAAIGAALQAGSALYGAIESSKALKDLRDKIGVQRKDNKKWYEETMAEDYMMRPEVQNVVRKDTEMLSDQMKRSRAINLVAGGTDESLALQQEAALKTHGDTMATIAEHSSAVKDEAKREYREREAALTQQEMALDQAKAQNIATAAGQVGKAVSGLVSGAGMDATNATDGAEASADFISKQKEWSSGFEPTTKTDVTKYNV